MKKQLFVLTAAAIVALSACKKSNNGSTETPDDFSLPYSNLPVEEQKKGLEKSGINFIDEITELPNVEAVNVIEHLASLNSPAIGENSFTKLVNAVVAAKQKQYDKVMEETGGVPVDPAETQALSDFFGVYNWNAQIADWDKVAATDRLELNFPASVNATSNNAKFVMTYKSSGIYFVEGSDKVELPSEVTGKLTVGTKELLTYKSTASYKSDATPTATSSTLTLGAYVVSMSGSNNGTVAASDFSIKKGEKVLIASSSKVDGNTGSISGNESTTDIVNNANTTFQVMNLKIAGKVDVKTLSKVENNVYSEAAAKKFAEAVNANSALVAINTDDNTVFAKVKCYAKQGVEVSYEWDGTNWYPKETKVWKPAFKLQFKDGSLMEVGTYFETGFDNFIDKLNELVGKF